MSIEINPVTEVQALIDTVQNNYAVLQLQVTGLTHEKRQSHLNCLDHSLN
jgi:hypothetical protein